jgi:hypothetical protein
MEFEEGNQVLVIQFVELNVVYAAPDTATAHSPLNCRAS